MAGSGALQNSPIFSALTSSPSSSSSSPPRVHVLGSPQTPTRPYSSSSSTSQPSPLPSSMPPMTNQCKTSRNPNKEGLFMGPSPGTFLKKKRPARIHIPVSQLGFGFELPKLEETMDFVEVDQANGYSVYCKKGRKGAMEDRYSAFVDFHTDSIQAFFGVFDGHGGPMAAEFAAKNLHENIKDQLMMMTSGESEKKNIEEAVKNGYLMTDKNFLKEGISGGTCCLTALIQDHSLVISNAGDCRAVMSRRGVAEALTSDHRPSRKDEKDRIQTLGGYVDCCRGVWRVQGSLAVTRGIGDGNLKQWVIAEPETKVLKIKPDCEFLILGSDGLWDKVSNQEAVDAARPLFMDVDKSDVLSACKQLVDLSIKRGSTDDISVMIIQLGHFVSCPSSDTILKKKRLPPIVIPVARFSFGFKSPKCAEGSNMDVSKVETNGYSVYLVSNDGDCRAVMSRRGVAEALTSDHRPLRKDERDRIQTLEN
ncbi:hypothetical protein FEM48_Zijuj03G0107700 [Ziziphus jujuba var. spinosa]|uniref:protein-serine/threonine phosphatase n=1 Tax=Ziziphus jujuba var. spinosa TaxID=714518 RepID=A0A978VPV2_ZIZJJ|nr:hypothetical protein FEM48_Zijuj03G0107700 [Ziziphus jujuba var. spinosa]